MAATATFGAAIGSDVLTKSVEIEKTADIAVWKNNVGVDVKVKDFNPMTKGSITIGGIDSAIEPGVAASLPLASGTLTGGVITVPSVKDSYTQDGGAEQVVSFEHRPSAAELT